MQQTEGQCRNNAVVGSASNVWKATSKYFENLGTTAARELVGDTTGLTVGSLCPKRKSNFMYASYLKQKAEDITELIAGAGGISQNGAISLPGLVTVFWKSRYRLQLILLKIHIIIKKK